MNREVIESVKDLINVLDMAEKTASELDTDYKGVLKKLDTEKVYPKHRIATGLSIAEAIYLASIVEKTHNLQNLRAYLLTMPTGENKALYEAFLNGCEVRFRHLIKMLGQIDYEFFKLRAKEVKQGLKTLEQIERETYQQNKVGLATSLDGANYRSRVEENSLSLVNLLKNESIKNFLLGKSEQESLISFSLLLSKGSSHTRRLIRTESTRVHCQAKIRALQEKGYTKYRYVAVLDKRTSKMCRAMNGKEFYLWEAVPGVNLPPLHPWCRSTIMGIKE